MKKLIAADMTYQDRVVTFKSARLTNADVAWLTKKTAWATWNDLWTAFLKDDTLAYEWLFRLGLMQDPATADEGKTLPEFYPLAVDWDIYFTDAAGDRIEEPPTPAPGEGEGEGPTGPAPATS